MKKCLVVDDSELNLEMSVELLKGFGILAEGTDSGKRALEELAQRWEEYSVVLMDYRMPDMDGAETTRRVRALEQERGAEKPLLIIGMTGDSDEETRENLLAAGMDDVMSKPVEPAALIEYLVSVGLVSGEEEAAMTLKKSRAKEDREGATVLPSDDRTIAPEDERLEQLSRLERLKGALFSPEKGIRYAGSVKLYMDYLKHFAMLGEEKQQKAAELLERGDAEGLTFVVHTLKSTARALGNEMLSDLSLKMEEAAKKADISFIKTHFGEWTELYRESVKQIESCIDDRKEERKRIPSPGEIEEMLKALWEAVETFDLDSADRCIAHIGKLVIPASMEEDLKKIIHCIADVNFEGASNLLKKWR